MIQLSPATLLWISAGPALQVYWVQQHLPPASRQELRYLVVLLMHMAVERVGLVTEQVGSLGGLACMQLGLPEWMLQAND